MSLNPPLKVVWVPLNLFAYMNRISLFILPSTAFALLMNFELTNPWLHLVVNANHVRNYGWKKSQGFQQLTESLGVSHEFIFS